MVVIDLKAGQEANLTQQDPTLKKVKIGLGWDIKEKGEFSTEKSEFSYDLDASAFLLGSRKTIRHERDFVFYNNLESVERSVFHSGDDETGEGDGDNEIIHVHLDLLPFDVHYISFCVTIHDGYERRQNFGMVQNAYIRVINEDTNEELAHFDLTEDYKDFTGVVLGELYRIGSEWLFMAKGEGHKKGLLEIAKLYDVNVIES